MPQNGPSVVSKIVSESFKMNIRLTVPELCDVVLNSTGNQPSQHTVREIRQSFKQQ